MYKLRTYGINLSKELHSSDALVGYVFFDTQVLLEQTELKSDTLTRLFESYQYNCGVFCAFLRKDEKLFVFTDPFAQFPVFYRVSYGRVNAVSLNLWDLKNLELNEQALVDFYSYQSPLRRETAVRDAYRLGPFEYLECVEVDNQPGQFDISIKKYPLTFLDDFSDYKEGLRICAERARARANLMSSLDSLNLQLSGGLDSRLSLAMLLAADRKPKVFTFGDYDSEDRQIAEIIKQRYKLDFGKIVWCGSPPKTSSALAASILGSWGLKSNNLTNYLASPIDSNHVEITGFFAEGLLKGFGSVFDKNTKSITVFDWGRKTTDFNYEIFDISLDRCRDEVESCFSYFKKSIVAEMYFYSANRSASHFGVQSRINNINFRSFDLLYDPMFLALINVANYSDSAIRSGAVILDLIFELYGEELALLPYENRILKPFNSWTQNAFERLEPPSAFHGGSLPNINSKELVIMSPERFDKPDQLGIFSNIPTIEELCSELQADFPLFVPKSRNGLRPLEHAIHKYVATLHFLLKHNSQYLN